MEHTSPRSILADLVDLSVQMDLDAAMDPGDLRHRDRDIGRELKHLAGKPQSQLRHWLWRVTKGKQQSFPGNRAIKIIRLITLILFFLGATAGWITALGVFAYDGTQPVNVVNVLAVFVGLQLLLLLTSAIIALPRNLLRFIPGARPLQDLFSVLSPGRLVSIITRFLPPEHRLALEAALGRQKAHHIIYGRVRKWLILQLSQVFAVAFNLGALMSCLYLVTLSDLAFGWSTTLEFEAERFHGLVQQLAWPWRDWLEGAVPSLELINTSRFYRLNEGILPNAIKLEDVSMLGEWWPFLFLGIIFYGLLPRLVTLAFAHWRLKTVLDSAFIHAPSALQVLDRMNHAVVETGAVEPEARAALIPEAIQSVYSDNFAGAKGYLINWAGINTDESQLGNALRRAMAVEINHVLHAGGKNPIEQDQRIIDELRTVPDEPAIIVVVKSWEPPILDFLDFLESLRAALGPERLITIIPVSLSHKHDLIPADPSDLDIWRKKLQSLGDPRIIFHPLSFEAN